jgi:hypothetical protein
MPGLCFRGTIARYMPAMSVTNGESGWPPLIRGDVRSQVERVSCKFRLIDHIWLVMNSNSLLMQAEDSSYLEMDISQNSAINGSSSIYMYTKHC